MSGFSLTKWYMDAADSRGNVYLGYWARLQWKAITLQGHQHLWRAAGSPVRVQGGLSRDESPAWTNDRLLAWQAGAVRAQWQTADDGFGDTLYQAERGEITWRCTQPRAAARIELPGLSFSGWGYTECLELTVPIWQLPFRTLFWGRCHTDDHHLVWIGWRGDTERSLAWCDGKRSDRAVITADSVRAPDVQLDLDREVALRRGVVRSTALSAFVDVARILPRSALGMDEQKWYGRGVLDVAGATQSSTTIHEEVRW